MPEPLDLDSIEAAAAAATEGPWKVWAMSVLADPVGNSSLDDALPIADTTDPHRGLRTFNADFIAAARSWVPQLARELRVARHQLDAVRELCVAAEADEGNLMRAGRSWPLLDVVDVRAALSSVPDTTEEESK